LPLGQRAGLTDRQISELDQFEVSDSYSPLEKDVLRFTEQWATQVKVGDLVLGRLQASLPAAHLVLLAATVGQANFTTRFKVVFGVEIP
jgi:hypothetical protein